MKKSLLALATMGAFAGAAHAQSSVTVYGLLDMGYSSTKNKTSAGAETVATGLNTLNPLSTSRFGLRGVEDLGGGLSAGFQIEGAVPFQPGQSAATGLTFARHQFLTLTSKTAGGLLLGKTDASVKQIFDTYDAGFANNFTGAYDGMGTSLVNITGTNVIGNTRDMVIRYTTPSFSGATFTAGYLANSSKVTNAAGVATTDTEDNTGYELAGRYAGGPISAGIAYRNAKSQNIAQAAVAAVPGNAGTALVNAADVTTTSLAAGASYNFGPAIAFLQYFNQSANNNIAATNEKENAYALGVRAPVTKTATLFASYTTGTKTSITNIDSKMTGYQAGALYGLSKRTDLYALYGASNLKADNAVIEATASGMAIGLRHTF